jgi:DNA replication protein DnaC
VRQNYYSVPARYTGRRLLVRLSATAVEVLDGPQVVARHERAAGKYAEILALDHYLEVLKYKPGALPGATALAQARASGAFTPVHQCYWDAARRADGDAAGTRALIEMLLAHRTLPRIKRLADFNTDAVPAIAPAQLATLATGTWIDAGQPLVLLGDSGTGKTHMLISLGLAACEQGRRVRYVTTAALVNELAEAATQRQLSRVVGRYGRFDLLLLDELGYVQIDPRGAELLFQIITEREERASIGIGTNLPFSEWGTVFPDPRLVAAIVDRVTFNAHILETGTQSYRLRTSKTTSRSKNPG